MVDLLKIDPKNWICFFDQSEWSKRCKPYLKNGFDMMSVSVCWDDFDVVFFLNFIYGFLMCFCCCWLSIGFIRKSKIEANLIFSPVRPLQVHLNFLSLSLSFSWFLYEILNESFPKLFEFYNLFIKFSCSPNALLKAKDRETFYCWKALWICLVFIYKRSFLTRIQLSSNLELKWTSKFRFGNAKCSLKTF